LEIANDGHEKKTSEVFLPERLNAYSLRRIEAWGGRGEGEAVLP
jgi:hypothetical protein